MFQENIIIFNQNIKFINNEKIKKLRKNSELLMRSNKLIPTFVVFLLLIYGCNEQNFVSIDNGINDIKINVGIADSFDERAQGLMFRKFLDDNAGMLFVFEREDFHSFWMKNTLIPLDIIFISENLKIVDIKYAVPCEQDPCQSYRTIEPAKYVLEVNGNYTIKNNINIGNKINIKNL